MAIYIDEQKKLFTLSTNNTSYQMMADKYLVLNHLYYGENIGQEDMSYLLDYQDRGFSGNPYEAGNERDYSLDSRPQEYSTNGVGDYRINSVSVINADGSDAADWRYAGYTIEKGKYAIPGMPALYGEEKDADTLIVELADKVTGLHAFLYYSVWEERDIITRCVKFVNQGSDVIVLTKAASMNLDLMSGDWELMHFHGRHNLERQMERVPLMRGKMTVESVRGASSHQHNPFAILCSKDTTEEAGPCYGTALVYSGNFSIEAEKDQMGQTRLTAGINSQRFAWTLEAGAEFWTPEAVMTYSSEGFEKMSSNFHHTFREHLCRGKYKHERRPVLINNWEATYFDFDKEKILNIAKGASELGVEMLVLDDGWFGKREGDVSGLGDWYVNLKKLPSGISGLSRKVEELGLKFGLWVELEMVNKDSDLYRAHPDWIISAPERFESHARHQFVLDFSKKEVVDYIYEMVAKVIRESAISYIKWDMNRYMTEPYSKGTEPSQQGKVMHKYILGVYDLYTRLTTEFPEILFESGASGGARFDPAMLYFAPQTWTSDDTDASERTKIQYGTSYVYPIVSMGSHVSAVPNHQLYRTTPIETRANVAYFGTFGYELDLNLLSDAEMASVKKQIAFMKEYRELIQVDGDFYRLLSPFEGNETAWMVVSQDKTQAVAALYQRLNKVNASWLRLKLEGLDPDAKYQVSCDLTPSSSFDTELAKRYGYDTEGNQVKTYEAYGDELMRAGIPVDRQELNKKGGDFASLLYTIKKVD